MQHLLFAAGVVALQLAVGEQRLEGRVAVVEHGADILRSQLRHIHRQRRDVGADQHITLHQQGDAPDIIAGQVTQPRLCDVAAHINLAMFHGWGDAGPGQYLELHRMANLGGQAQHQVIQNALGRLAGLDLHQGHGPAVGNGEAQRGGCRQAQCGDHP